MESGRREGMKGKEKERKNEGGKERKRRVEHRERDRNLKEGDRILKFSSPAL